MVPLKIIQKCQEKGIKFVIGTKISAKGGDTFGDGMGVKSKSLEITEHHRYIDDRDRFGAG